MITYEPHPRPFSLGRRRGTFQIFFTHTTMKPKKNYIINVPLVHGEITVVTADHAEDTMRHSARLANAIKDAGLNVLAINCGMSDKRYRGHFYEAVGRESFRDPKCIIKSSVCGNLIGE